MLGDWTEKRRLLLNVPISAPCAVLKMDVDQISAKRGPASRFVVEANTEALVSKSNSRQSEYVTLEANIE